MLCHLIAVTACLSYPSTDGRNTTYTSQFQGTFFDPPVDLLTPMQCFKKFFADESFRYIADQSNLYPIQKDKKTLNTTAAEIEQFLGIILLTDIFSCSCLMLSTVLGNIFPI